MLTWNPWRGGLGPISRPGTHDVGGLSPTCCSSTHLMGSPYVALPPTERGAEPPLWGSEPHTLPGPLRLWVTEPHRVPHPPRYGALSPTCCSETHLMDPTCCSSTHLMDIEPHVLLFHPLNGVLSPIWSSSSPAMGF
uniref:Uncharacterized protein n=1 Tax=Calidris pygmaea TaxID=425635 RepID=A0A8C3JSE0_9CHAR